MDSCFALANYLKENQLMMATAESCTGGWVAKTLTDLAGASAWFDRAYITYSNTAKEQALNVSSITLEKHGAVSEECVLEMVTNLLEIASVSVGISVSGIAGPAGGSLDKPVGLVWFAFAKAGCAPLCVQKNFTGERDDIRREACHFAITGLLNYLRSLP